MLQRMHVLQCLSLRQKDGNNGLSLYISIHQDEPSNNKCRKEYSNISSQYYVDVFPN
jgi:hypothetical protein